VTAPYPISAGVLYVGTIVTLGVIAALFVAIGFTPRRCLRWLKDHVWLTALYTGLTLVVVHLLFFAPPVGPKHFCAYVVHLNDTLSFGLSCDSDEFIRIARHPGEISREGSFRQGRPLIPMVAALGTLVEHPSLDRHTKPAPDVSGCTGCLQSALGVPYQYLNQPGWLPYVFLNLVVLVVAVLTFDRLVRRTGTGVSIPVLLLSVLLLANVVTKNFFWSAHTQMWNILMPIACVTACAAIMRNPERSWQFMSAVGLLIGLGTLAYGTIVLLLPAIVLAGAVGRRLRGERVLTSAAALAAVVATVGTLIPPVAWRVLLVERTGRYYDPETRDYRQFVWMWDAFKDGGVTRLLNQTDTMLREFWPHLWVVSWPPLLLLGVVLLITGIAQLSLHEIAVSRREEFLAVAVTLLLALPFFALQGFYRDRLAFNVAVPIVIAVGLIAVEVTRMAPRAHAVALNVALGCGALGYLLPFMLDRAQYV
jgi:hypothetical protein